ncbi:hypothetical protein AB0M28_40455 [Streptomyces sp. NPDC051940]|uniref:hypothetical protein n=1 Tax=Streptomyces sp. NPDC051940 TaxID=3155675 RepID=UPI00342231F9
MRPRQALAAAAALLTVAFAPGAAAAAAQPAAGGVAAAELSCEGRDFPLDAALSGGPSTYTRGAAPEEWTLKLHNSSRTVCENVHPVAVLVDESKLLAPGHIRLAFYDDDAHQWRDVRFKATERAENVGVFEDGFHGLTVRPAQTVSVRLRLAFTEDAPAGGVTAAVAAMQRRAGDGSWAGQSPSYDLTVTEPGAPDASPQGSDLPRATAAAPAPAVPWGGLADSGPGLAAGLGCTAGAFLLGGGAFLVGSRRLRQTPSSRSHHR